MNDVQIWATIATCAAVLIGLSERMARVFGKSMDTRFEVVGARFDAMDARFDQVDSRFDRLETRFDRLEARVDGLDRDVTALTRRQLGDQ